MRDAIEDDWAYYFIWKHVLRGKHDTRYAPNKGKRRAGIRHALNGAQA